MTIKRDATAPGILWNGGPADESSHYFGDVPAAPTCDATDALSGPKSCEVTGYSTAVGIHTLKATAYDLAGNKTIETRSYTVKAWTLTGFYQPVDMSGVVTLNTVKSGSTVPLKFEVFVGPAELTDTAVIQSFTWANVSCNDFGPTSTEDPIEQVTSGATALRYDATAGQFVQNWQTPKNKAGSCYRVTMTTDDGSKIVANFKLK